MIERKEMISWAQAHYDGDGLASAKPYWAEILRILRTPKIVKAHADFQAGAKWQAEQTSTAYIQSGSELNVSEQDKAVVDSGRLREIAKAIHKIAFSMRAPNAFTPQFVQLANEIDYVLRTPQQPQPVSVGEDVERRLPIHKAALHITHNDHKTDYMTAAEYAEQEWLKDSWVGEEEKQRAIETDSIWELQWYPDTPIGFYKLAASSLAALLTAIQANQKGG